MNTRASVASRNFSFASLDGNEATGILTGVQAEEEIFPEEDIIDEGVPKVTSALPTMWLGAQSGKYVINIPV